MRVTKKLAGTISGISAFALVGTAAAMPVSAQANGEAPTLSHPNKSLPKKVITLESKENTALDVDTEVDCTSHTLSAKVTNKTNHDITPHITFNDDDPAYDIDAPIKPGKDRTYFYNFTGNHMMVETKIAVDGEEDLTLSPTVHCNEPITFRLEQSGNDALSGYVQNNSSLVAQTVLMRVGTGDIRTVSLQPGESTFVALPFTGFEGQESAIVTMGTATGFEGTYTVELGTGGIIIDRK